MKTGRKLFPLLLCLFLTTGCWDQKVIQNMVYLTAIGIDYTDGQYVFYTQTVDLARVAKQETQADEREAPAVIAVGRGDTPQSAIDNLIKNAQIPTFTGFVSSLIFHERILEKGILPVYDILNRSGLLRYTKWVFGTHDKLEEVLSVQPVLGFSPESTLLHQPVDVYKQRSFIQPIRFHEFISEYWEPANTILLPSITVVKNKWKMDSQFITRLSLNGVFAIHHGKLNGFFPEDELLGLRWLTPRTQSAGIVIRKNGKSVATVRLQRPDVVIRPKKTKGPVRFDISIRVKGYIRELMEDNPSSFIRKESEKEIERQIRGAFEKSLRSGVDLLRLGYVLFREDYQRWKQMPKSQAFPFQANALAKVEVNVDLADSGKMKLDWYDYPRLIEQN
jgi:germination protein, Ger(x)C family